MEMTTRPAQATEGDSIEHDLVPGFTMRVKGTRPCETDGARPEPHDAYQVTDPEGNEDWLCAYDVHKSMMQHPRR
jgi:hypothetical protein